MRILVVDDDPIYCRVLETALSDWGYEVRVCSDAHEAWTAMNSEGPPEIAILDWLMPGVTGLDLCRRVRESKELASIYIILLTAMDRKGDVVKGLEAGADDYLSKPFEFHELRARVRVAERLVDARRQDVREATAHYVAGLEQAVGELKESRRRIVAVQEATRKEIAHQLHGPVQTQLILISERLSHIGEMMDSSPESARNDLSAAIASLDMIQEDVIRNLSHQLHPSIVGAGLRAGIKSLRDTYDGAVPIELDIAEDVAKLEPEQGSTIPFDTRLGLYRIANEALGNVVKHAGAKGIFMRLWLESGVLCLTVEDDGRGFEADLSKPGLGLTTMEDYMGALGGFLDVDTAPARGTRITARVTLDGHRDVSAADLP